MISLSLGFHLLSTYADIAKYNGSFSFLAYVLVLTPSFFAGYPDPLLIVISQRLSKILLSTISGIV